MLRLAKMSMILQPPHRFIAGEFASHADVEAYDTLEGVQAARAALDTYTSHWGLHTFELRSDYSKTPDGDP